MAKWQRKNAKSAFLYISFSIFFFPLFKVFVDVYSSLDTPFFSIAGNHDYKVPDEMIDQFKTGIPDVAARNERMFEASREMLRAQLEYKGSNLWWGMNDVNIKKKENIKKFSSVTIK